AAGRCFVFSKPYPHPTGGLVLALRSPPLHVDTSEPSDQILWPICNPTAVTMAKGRKFESSHRERLIGSFGYSPDQPSGDDHSELAEEDVWSKISGGIDHDGGAARRTGASRWCRADGELAERLCARAEDRQVGGLSLAFEDGGKASARIAHQSHHAGREVAASSAPVNVPDWPKILRVDSAESMQDGYGAAMNGGDGDDDEWVPPHEYLARSRRSSAAAHSVFEGVGRTLKGRDMSRVRNAVWSQTGFYG
ncbi:hypothetical protein ACLOJK_029711, partial [Asimina triloba]